MLTEAEFALFFEGADLEKRFVESPAEWKKFSRKAVKSSCDESAVAAHSA